MTKIKGVGRRIQLLDHLREKEEGTRSQRKKLKIERGGKDSSPESRKKCILSSTSSRISQ